MPDESTGPGLLRPAVLGTVLQLAMVVAGHYVPSIQPLFPIVGTGIGGVAGVLTALGGKQSGGAAAKNGVLAGGLGGLIGTVVSYFLGDIPAFTIGVGTGASGVAGALGALVTRLIGQRNSA